jgi:hypothetical protein
LDRQRRERGSAAFYREQEGEERSPALHGPSMAFFIGRVNGRGERTKSSSITRVIKWACGVNLRLRARESRRRVSNARRGQLDRSAARRVGIAAASRRSSAWGGEDAQGARRGGALGAAAWRLAQERARGEKREIRGGRERSAGGGGLAGWRARSLGFWGIGPLVGRFSVGLVFFFFFLFNFEMHF